MRAFHNRGNRISTGVEFISINVFSQITIPNLEQQVAEEHVSIEQMEVGNTEELGIQTEDVTPQPLAVVFPEDVEQEWERQQANLDAFSKKLLETKNSLLNQRRLVFKAIKTIVLDLQLKKSHIYTI